LPWRPAESIATVYSWPTPNPCCRSNHPVTGAIAAAHGTDCSFSSVGSTVSPEMVVLRNWNRASGEGLRKIEPGIVGATLSLPGFEYSQWSCLVETAALTATRGRFLRNDSSGPPSRLQLHLEKAFHGKPGVRSPRAFSAIGCRLSRFQRFCALSNSPLRTRFKEQPAALDVGLGQQSAPEVSRRNSIPPSCGRERGLQYKSRSGGPNRLICVQGVRLTSSYRHLIPSTKVVLEIELFATTSTQQFPADRAIAGWH